MHTRRTLAIGALAFVLAGCGGQEAGPTPRGGGQATSPDALAVKLTALTTDECYRTPARQLPKGCQKYVTELSSTAGMVRAQAGLTASADGLAKEIDDYRSAHCDTVPTPGNPCSETLSRIADTLREIKLRVDTQVTSR
ncbi:MAG TPA: hypothetical protein VJT49_13130 [Amycolatopsis sp.]|uniref:hypothetical protein n=1 Tax=Amycolatopsis sp. TaxID=37632 RepID=UPI002B4742A5|nr:hypothetical protein [Amycolatopsis sp.]HKS46028.1 hypothetical protein [Amycolatopsis sp.]